MRRLIVALFVALAAAFAPHALAQTWPTKAVKMVVPFPPGGPVDTIARTLAPRLQETLGQPFVIENRPGAGGTLGASEVARTAPDGHTILITAGTPIVVGGLMYPNLGYDPMTALAPVAQVGLALVYLETRAGLPVNSLAEFIAHARANPGKLNYGSPGIGSSPHLSAVMLNGAAKIHTTHVPYKGAGPAIKDLLGGQIDFMFDPGVGLEHVKAGKLKLLAVGSPRRHLDYPNVPTVAEILGVEFDTDTVFGVYAPVGTPNDIVARLNQQISNEM